MKINSKKNLSKPKLRFTPTAWAKLLFLRDAGETEVGGFGICPNELLLVEDIQLVSQQCTHTTVQFNDESVANFFDDQVDGGLSPEQFARIWIHTHPGECPLPSRTDEKTFARVFGKSDWAVMFILAMDNTTYCRLSFNTGPGYATEIPIEFDFSHSFSGTDHESWQREYDDNVTDISAVLRISVFDESLQSDNWLLPDESEIFDERWNLLPNQEDEFEYLY